MKESKIEILKIKNAQNQFLKKYDFLNIKNIFPTSYEKGKDLTTKFSKTGIYKYDNRPIASFPFHNNGIIDKNLYIDTHEQAREIFREKLIYFGQKYRSFYILMNLEYQYYQAYYFWVEIMFSDLQENLNKIWQQHGDFAAFREDIFALDIYNAEYEWEVLLWENNNLNNNNEK